MQNSISDAAAAVRPARLLSALAVLSAAALIAPFASAQHAEQRVFATPQAAVAALIAAAGSNDPKAALAPILGPESDRILSSGDPVADENARKNFLREYSEMHRLAYDTDGRVVLYMGADNWPMPVPLVKKGDGWVFDTPAGEQELVFRRIGANELYTIDVLQTLVDAQGDYADQARAASGVSQYAQKILSDHGKHNGLYWPAAPGELQSPIGPLIVKATSEGYKPGKAGQPIPFHGYFYRVLTGQGKAAPGGSINYVHDGRMTSGFAFLAYPAEYRSSGVMTFIVNQDGVVWQKDLGPGTAQLAAGIKRYDPGQGWEKAQPQQNESQNSDTAGAF